MQTLVVCAVGVVGPVLGAATVLGSGFVGLAGFAGLWRFPLEEAAPLSNHSAQSPASA